MNMNDYKNVTDRLEPSARCRNEVLSMTKKKKHNIKLTKRGIALIAAAVVAVCGGTAAYAIDKLGVFDRLDDTLSESYVDDNGNEWKKDKFENHDFEQISQTAQPLTEPMPLDGEEISITVESVYCDGNTIILGLSGSLADGNTEGNLYIPFEPVIEMNDIIYSRDTIRQTCVCWLSSKLYLDSGTQNSFSGNVTITVSDFQKIEEPTDINFKLRSFVPTSGIYGNYDENTPVLSDSFEFSLNVTPDESLVRHINHTFKDSDGYFVTILDMSPVGIQQQVWTMSEEIYHRQPYQEEVVGSKLYSVWTDSNGNTLEYIPCSHTIKHNNGSQGALLQPPETDIINIKFYDANNPDENGNPLFVHEMTIDLENLCVIE